MINCPPDTNSVADPIPTQPPPSTTTSTPTSAAAANGNSSTAKNDPLSSEDIAHAGDDGCFKCFSCGGCLRSWKSDDNPYVEHARWFPKCLSLLQAMGQDFIDVVQDLHRVHECNRSISYDEVIRQMKEKGLSIVNQQALPSAATPQEVKEEQGAAARNNINIKNVGNQDNNSSTNEMLQSGEVTKANSRPVINSLVQAIPTQPPPSTTTSTTTSAAAASGSSSTLTTSSNSDQIRGLDCQKLGIFKEKPRNPRYAALSSRIGTYKDWPGDHPVSREDIARAGFYYRGYRDSCECFCCGGCLSSWKPNDNPFVEHARMSPKCMFLLQATGQDFVDFVQEILRVHGLSRPIDYEEIKSQMQERGLSIVNQFEDNPFVESDPAVRAVIDAGYSEEQVVAVARQLPRDTMSSGTVLQEVKKLHGAVPVTNMNTINFGNQDDNSFTDEISRRLEQLRSQNDQLRHQLLCKICKKKEIRMVFLPCGHFISCQECAMTVQACQSCRSHIKATTRAILPTKPFTS